MALDRGTLVKIDRRIFAEFRHDGGTQVVKVPLSDAAWSTWRRYCQAIGLTMGEAIAGLVDHELSTVVGEAGGDSGSLYAGRAEEQLAARRSQLATWKRDLVATEQRLRGWAQHLRIRERELETREHRLEVASKLFSSTTPERKVGRNEPCPCGSGRKYKRCHGVGSWGR